MYILGINISHDSSTCLLRDGEIIFYQEFERPSRIKHYTLLRHAPPEPYLFYHNKNIKEHTKFVDHIIFSSYDRDYSPTESDKKLINFVLNQIRCSGIEWGSVIFNRSDHHLYHASTGAFSSGFEECACLIMDGSGARYGDNYEEDERAPFPFREIESIYSFDYSKGLKKKFKHYSRLGHSLYKDFGTKKEDDCIFAFSDSLGCGTMFNRFSIAMGYNAGNDAGKIMGLASYGSNLNTYGNWFSYIDDVGITNNNLIYPISNTIKQLSSQEQKNVLRILQEETKNHTIRLIEKALKLCNTNNIILSGGYFLNCVNNYHYLKEFPNVNFYVDPIAHDGGTSIGAAKYLWYELTKDKTIRKLDTLYL